MLYVQIAGTDQHKEVHNKAAPSDQEGGEDDDDESRLLKTEHSGEETCK